MTAPPIRADGHLPRQGEAEGGERRVVEVAVGILLRPDGRFLLTSRPPGKVYAGYWEFPGGKLEPGESVEQALARELHEELGVLIEPAAVMRWREQLVDYPHALVRLHFCRVTAWQGALQMREGQQAAWERLPVGVQPVLAGTLPVLQWLGEEARAEPRRPG
ncbi:MAG: NUDIX domain-containing protein [Burkholderiaceae bacterium]